MKKYLRWVSLLLLCNIVYAQIGNTSQYDTPTITPQTPEVTSLLRYSEVPVSYYNGIPNIGVPIYTLQGRELSVPINLSYHAGGHRVTEESGWVGLGWSLSAGGQITRTVRGRNDDKKPWGFIHNIYTVDIVKRTCHPDPNNPPPYDYSCEFYTNETNSAIFDFEPDEFNYSMLGQSGKFMFSQDRSSVTTGKIIQFPNKDVKIEPIFEAYDPNDSNNLNNDDSGNIVAWNIIDKSGNIFHFVEGNKFYQSQIFQEVDGALELPNGGNNAERYTETWDLVSVTSPSGDVLTFEYDRPILPNHTETSLYNDVNTIVGSESFIFYDGRYAGTSDPNRHPNKHIKAYSTVYRSYTSLSKISSSKGFVEFVRDTQDRQDTQSPKQRLRYINIFDTDNNKIQQISLEHSYFESTPSDENEFILTGETGNIAPNTPSFLSKRLKLDRVVFQGMYNGHDDALDYSYRFDYNTDVMLPHKRSQAQDHWGYYNGALSNNSLIPKKTRFICNRIANPAYSSACVLNKITYPEGGVTKLFYENNRGDIKNMDTQYKGAEVKVAATMTYPHTIENNGVGNTYTFTNTFSITNTAKPSATDSMKTQVRYVGFSNRCDTVDSFYGNPNDQVCNHITFTITNTTDGVVAYSGSIWEHGFIDLLKGKTYKLEINIIDPYGQYNMGQHTTEITIKWMEENLNPPDDYFFDYFGGLRVQGIKTYDDNKLTAYRSFEYTYGYILSKPDYFAVSSNNIQKYISQSWVPLLTTQSGYVGYGQVKELIHPVAIEKGYSTLGNSSVEPREIFRKYSFFGDVDGEYFTTFFPGAPFSFGWMGGNILLENVEDKSTTHYQYLKIDNHDVEEIYGIKLDREYRIERYSSANLKKIKKCIETGICDMSYNLYKVWSGQWLPQKKIVITKEEEGTQELLQETTSEYASIPNHHNPTKTVTIDSKGDVYETTYSYPHEENHIGLLSENRLNIPLVTKQYKGTELIQSSKVNYSSFAGTANNQINLLPSGIFGSKKTNALEERLTYHGYTPYGQPREVSKTDGVHITYLWGYNYNYPVAKIENATYSQVTAVVAESSLQNLTGTALENVLTNLRNSLPNAMVSTFIYQPMIGVTQTTDPRGRNTYYKYDSMGRLKYVLDHDQHVLSKNNYHYRDN